MLRSPYNSRAQVKGGHNMGCRLITYRHRFARVAPAPPAKQNEIQRIVDARRPSSCLGSPGARKRRKELSRTAVIPDPRAARSLRFSPRENGRRISSVKKRAAQPGLLSLHNPVACALAGRYTVAVRASEPREGQYWFINSLNLILAVQ